MRQQKVALAASALAIAIALGGCQQFEGTSTGQEEPTDSQRTETPVVSDPGYEGDSDSQGAKTEDHLVVETEYGDLYYPAQWGEYLSTSQETVGGSLSVVFSAKIGETEYPMFQVTIGESEDTEVGELTDDSGAKRAVHMSVFELEEDPSLSAEEQQRMYAMQEDLNYVIDHLA